MLSAAIMSVVLAVVLTATIQIYSGTNRIDQTSAARDQLDISFRRLDRELRYAIWTSQPGQKDGKWYLEYALPPDVDKNTGDVVGRPCRQLIFGGDVLALAAWDSMQVPKPVNPPTTLATGVTVAGGGSPYIINAPNVAPSAAIGVSPGYVPGFQQVRLKFEIKVGNVKLPFDSVFTSLNLDKAATEKANDCKNGRP